MASTKTVVVLAGLLVVVGAALFASGIPQRLFKPEPPSMAIGKKARAHTPITLALQPMMELDGMTRAQIYALRSERVASYPSLAPEPYQPSESVFGQITDARPWWGVGGIYSTGSGPQSIAGVSYQSLFIGNPYLLIALGMGVACAEGGPVTDPSAYDVIPSTVTVDPDAALLRVDYEMRKHFAFMARWCRGTNHPYTIETLNARDMGFQSVAIDVGASSNITPDANPGALMAAPHFLHTGDSCGYPGGCNNRSPKCPELQVHITRLPAKVTVKLWRTPPVDVTAPQDATAILTLNGP